MIRVQTRKFFDLSRSDMMKIVVASKKKRSLGLESSAVNVEEKSNGKFDIIWEYVVA